MVVAARFVPASAWRKGRVLNLPGLATSVEEMVAAMGRLAGAEPVRRVVWKPDAKIQAILQTWPVPFRTPRALALGFNGDPDIDSVIRGYMSNLHH